MKKRPLLSLLIGLWVLSATACKNNTTPKTIEVKTQTAQTVKASFDKAQKIAMNIEGMVCAMGCAAVIEKNLNQTAGIKEAKVDFETKKATLIYDAEILTPNEITQVVLKTGESYSVKDFKLLV